MDVLGLPTGPIHHEEGVATAEVVAGLVEALLVEALLVEAPLVEDLVDVAQIPEIAALSDVTEAPLCHHHTRTAPGHLVPRLLVARHLAHQKEVILVLRHPPDMPAMEIRGGVQTCTFHYPTATLTT